MEAVLPRIKTKRKRRRRPPPHILYCVAWVTVSLASIALNIIFMIIRDIPQSNHGMIFAEGLGIILYSCLVWQFWQPIKEWLGSGD